jgi:predicted MFS family arabinose efflux permease
MSGPLRRLLIATAGGFLGLYLELSAIPYLAARQDGRFAAGLPTFALMLTTVAVQAAVPVLLRRVSARALFAAGLLLMGPPTLLYSVSQSVLNLTLVTLVRGAGFGLLTVMGSALVAAYSSRESRGSALGAYGVATSAAAAFAPALGVAIGRASPDVIFVLGTLPPLVGATALIPQLPPATIHGPRPADASTDAPFSVIAPVITFTVIAMAIAAAFTFVPLLPVGSTPLLLVLFGAGFASGRLAGGRLLDRGYPATVLVLRMLAGTVIGLALLGISDLAAAAVGAVVSGVVIGCIATATLVIMLDRSGPNGVARASVIWNMTFDVGQAVGAISLGAVASLAGTGGVFLALACLVTFVAAPAAVFDWRQVRLRVFGAV